MRAWRRFKRYLWDQGFEVRAPEVHGTVADAGGGMVEILVDRDTMQYPPKGARVVLWVGRAGSE